MAYVSTSCKPCGQTSKGGEFVRRRQVKFECSEEFYLRLNEEKLRRNLTLQQMAIRALEWYFTLPESSHRRIDESVGVGDAMADKIWRAWIAAIDIDAPTKKGVDRNTTRRSLEVRKLLEMIEEHLDHFPMEKLRLLQQSLALDLKYYQSARIKTSTPALD
jgi:hypothetical protein